MTGFLLDTCFISEFEKSETDAGVELWLSRVDRSLLYLSVLTIGEVRYGIESVTNRSRRTHFESWLAQMLDAFASRILPVDVDCAQEWGRLRAAAKRAGRPTPSIDTLIAATARAHGLSIVTRNERDFDAMQVSIVNPWSSSG